jgi:ribosome-associated translation inhibitor RaiA
MNIQFNTDKNIDGNAEFTAPYVAQIEDELSRYRDDISRIEVHLSDEDGSKNGFGAMRCMIEARVEGRQPIIVTNQADSHGQAVGGALDKLTTSLETIMGRQRTH